MSTKLLNIAETGTVMDTFLTLGNLVIKTQADRPIKKKKDAIGQGDFAYALRFCLNLTLNLQVLHECGSIYSKANNFKNTESEK